MNEHGSEQELLSAVTEAPAVAAPGAAPGAAPRGASGLAAAMGNHAFGTQFGGGAVSDGGGPLAQAGSVLARALFADPKSATRAPWASLRSETEQSMVNFSLLDQRIQRSATAAPAEGIEQRLADVAAGRRNVARQDHPPGSTADPASTASGVDWAGFFTGNTMGGIRSVLEVTRIWPGVGAWTGLASDVANTLADVGGINNEEAPGIKIALVIRGVLNALNNFIGHINYIGQIATDAAGISVVAAWVKPIVDAIGMTLKEVKLLLDLALMVIDICLWAAAEQQARHATGSAKEAWNGMIGNYRANLIGDFATLFIDGWDALTATEGQGEITKQALYSIRGFVQATRKFWPTFINWVSGLFNVWGSKATTPSEPKPPEPAPVAGGPAPASTSTPPSPPPPVLARVVAGDVLARLEMGEGGTSMARKAASIAIQAELTQVRVAYDMADGMLGVAGDMLAQHMQQQRETLTALLGGRDPFEFIRDAGVNLTKMVAERAAQLEQAVTMSTSGKERADQLRSGCDSVLNYVNGIDLPEVDVPGAGLILDPIRAAINEGKSMARGPVEGLKNNADEVSEYLGIFADIAREQIASARKQLEDFAEGLGKCTTFEQVCDQMLKSVQTALGMGTDFKIQDVRDWWASLGPEIDAAMEWARQLGEDQPPAEAPDLNGGGKAAPADPPSPEQAAAGAAGAKVPGKPMGAPAGPADAAAGAGAPGAAPPGTAAGAAAPGAAAGAAAAGAGAAAGPVAAGAAAAPGAAAAAGAAVDAAGAAPASAAAAGAPANGNAAAPGAAAGSAAAGGATIEEQLAAAVREREPVP